MDIITQLVASLGPSGALVWFLWHTTSKTIPELMNSHTKAMETISNSFTASLEDERAECREEINSLKTWIRAETACRYRPDSLTHIKEHS